MKPDDIVWTYSGVRPLYDDGASKAQAATARLCAEGGRIRTARRRSSTSSAARSPPIAGSPSTCWRRSSISSARRASPGLLTAPLPGGEFPGDRLRCAGREAEGGISVPRLRLARRLTRLYGTRAKSLLGLGEIEADLGRQFGPDLYEAEVRYLIDHEWAVTAEDVLWRRTKRGLTLSSERASALDEYMKRNYARRADRRGRMSRSAITEGGGLPDRAVPEGRSE